VRNKSDRVLQAIGESGGMLGFSMYPFHLKNGPDCTLKEFCRMIGQTAEIMGIDRLGIGSDMCEGWGYETLEWMRSGRWTFAADYGEGTADNKEWPRQPDWFQGSQDIMNIADGLAAEGFTQQDIDKVMGRNWLRFFEQSFEPLG